MRKERRKRKQSDQAKKKDKWKLKNGWKNFRIHVRGLLFFPSFLKRGSESWTRVRGSCNKFSAYEGKGSHK